MIKFPNSIAGAHKSLIKKEFSCSELTRAYLDKIKKENDGLNDFLHLTEKLALEQAKKVDDKIAGGEKIGQLEGTPMAIKDNILVEGHKTTAGSKILENYTAPYDATVIEKLKKAGAVMIGKTNLDEFAMGASTENSAFGSTKNPFDISRVPGGSSGGSAVAVAANHCLAALGSDTGGSIRQPASFCGVVGFKPSYGMVSRHGLIAMASSLDQIGALTKTVEDAQLIFNVIKGQDSLDSTTIDNTKYKIRSVRNKNLKIGIPKEYFGKGIDIKVKELVEQAIKNFEKIGAKIKEISLLHTEYALAVYYIIVPAEVSANLARYDGIKYGYSYPAGDRPKSGASLLDLYLKTRAQGFGDEVRRRIILGTHVLSMGYYEAYYGKAQKVRALIEKEFAKVFNPSADGLDVLLAPTAPTAAFKIGEKKDPLSMYLSDIYTVPASLAGLPAISIPCGTVDNLPVGLQIIGPQFQDDLLLEVAEKYEHISNSRYI